MVPLTNMKNVINAGYKKYSSKYCAVTDPLTYPLKCTETQFKLLARLYRRQCTDEQYKLWEPLDSVTINLTEDDELERVLQWFGECQEKKAWLRWRDELVNLEIKLRRKLKSAQISLGKEFIFSRRKGWGLYRHGSIKVLKRMWTLVESGVYNELLNISYRPPMAKVSQPRKLAIQGNIFVQFIFLLCGLLFGLVIFVAEFYKTIVWCFVSVRDLVGFLIEKLLQNMTCELLLNQQPLLLLYNPCRKERNRYAGGKMQLFVHQDSIVSFTKSP